MTRPNTPRCIILFLWAGLYAGVAASQPAATAPVVFTVDAGQLRAAVEAEPMLKAFAPFIRHDVEAHRITYTTHYLGEEVTVSGLILVPQEVLRPSPIAVWNHGTTFDNTKGPSDWSDSDHIEVVPATHGLITFLPDYPGYGVSKHLNHPYFIQEALVASVVDMIYAGKRFLREQGIATGDELYLWGFSEGGYATLAVQREIETNPAYANLTITASYPVAGPYDLKRTLDAILAGERYAIPGYLAFIFSTYNELYWHRPYTDFFQEPFAGRIAQYARQEMSINAAREGLPEALDSLFTPSFLASYRADGEASVKASFVANSDFDGWIPKAPTYLYQGTADRDVPFEIAEAMHASLLAQGADAEAVTLTLVEGADHNASGVASLLAFLKNVVPPSAE